MQLVSQSEPIHEQTTTSSSHKTDYSSSHPEFDHTTNNLSTKEPTIVDIFTFNWKSLGIYERESDTGKTFSPQEIDRSSTPFTLPQFTPGSTPISTPVSAQASSVSVSTSRDTETENESNSSNDSFPPLDSGSGSFLFNSRNSSNISGFFKTSRGSTPSLGNISRMRDSQSESSGGTFGFHRGNKLSQMQKKAYIKLQSQCNKFKGQNNGRKANYLRLTLLPFLRNNICEDSLVPPNSQIDLALKVFSAWWHECLEVLKSNFKNVTGADRDAFYEAVSSIISRTEWLDHHNKPTFRNLLSHTLIHLLTKCATVVHLPISLAAITGKCLAYAYLYIPDMAVYLLNLLDISPSAISRLGQVNLEQNFHKGALLGESNSAKDSPKLTSSALGSSSFSFSSSNNTLSSFISPANPFYQTPHLKDLVDAREKPNNNNINMRLSWLPFDNCKNWKRYFVVDSLLFVSFFKHLCVLQTQSLPISYSKDGIEFGDETKLFAIHGEASILSAPGMRLIFASIVTYLDKIVADSARSISPKNANPYGNRSNSDSPTKKLNMLEPDNFNANAIASPPPTSVSSPPQRFRADQFKIFTAMREILHSDDSTIPYVLAYSRIFDRILRAFTIRVRAHDVDGCVIACDLAEEWIYSVAAVNTTKACTAIVTFKSLTLDWDFWITVVKRMLETDNIHTQIRALSFLYNVWPYLPVSDMRNDSQMSTINDQSLPNGGMTGTNSEAKTTVGLLTEWLLSVDVWLRFFCHWSPLVRSYYHRLVCYRMASVGEESGSWLIDVESAQCIAEAREILKSRLANTFKWCEALSGNTKMKPEVVPSLPMPRFRVGVRQIGPASSTLNAKVETNLSRIYPFDVFDTAAYWQRDSNISADDDENVFTLRNSQSKPDLTSEPIKKPWLDNAPGTPPPKSSSMRNLSRLSSSKLISTPTRSRTSSRISGFFGLSGPIGEESPNDEFDFGQENLGSPQKKSPKKKSPKKSVEARSNKDDNPISDNTTEPLEQSNKVLNDTTNDARRPMETIHEDNDSDSSGANGSVTFSETRKPNLEEPLAESEQPSRNNGENTTATPGTPRNTSISSRMYASVSPLRRKIKQSRSTPDLSKEKKKLESSHSKYSLQKSWSSIYKLFTGKELNNNVNGDSKATASSDNSNKKDATTTKSREATAGIEELPKDIPSNSGAGIKGRDASLNDMSVTSEVPSLTSSSNASNEKKVLKPAFTYSREDFHDKSRKTDNKNYFNVAPIELTKPRPEIVRPPHRFVMIPTNVRLPVVNEIQVPKLPFSSQISVESESFDCNSRKQDKDLSIWNYAGRSLSEWNIEVSCFEGYIRQQEKTYSETLEMFNMPFLVAEIPWRSLG